jgi:hypothetical protein
MPNPIEVIVVVMACWLSAIWFFGSIVFLRSVRRLKVPFYKKLTFCACPILFYYLPFRFWLFKDLQPGITYEEFLKIIGRKVEYRVMRHEEIGYQSSLDLTKTKIVVWYDVHEVVEEDGKVTYNPEAIVLAAQTPEELRRVWHNIGVALNKPILECDNDDNA